MTDNTGTGNNSEVAELLDELVSNDVTRRHQARTALDRIGEPALPALLVSLAEGDFMTRWEVAKTLSEMDLPGAVPGLIKALGDEEQDVRWLAAVALAHIGRPSVMPLLEALADQPDAPYVRQGAHHFLTLYADPELQPHLRAVRDALGPFEGNADVVPVNRVALQVAREQGS